FTLRVAISAEAPERMAVGPAPVIVTSLPALGTTPSAQLPDVVHASLMAPVQLLSPLGRTVNPAKLSTVKALGSPTPCSSVTCFMSLASGPPPRMLLPRHSAESEPLLTTKYRLSPPPRPLRPCNALATCAALLTSAMADVSSST